MHTFTESTTVDTLQYLFTDSAFTPWIYAIIIVCVIFAGTSLMLHVDSRYERKEDHNFRRSAKVRARIIEDVDALEQRVGQERLDDPETDAMRTLARTVKNIKAAARDGRRATDYIEGLHAQLPSLEAKAVASYDVAHARQ